MERHRGQFIFLLLSLLTVASQANRFQVWGRATKPTHPSKVSGFDLNPFDDDDEDETIASKIIPATTALATMLYGSLLLVYPQDCRGQVYFLTMMRSTGYPKIEKGIKACKQNFRQAIRSAVWHAPSFLMAARSITQMKTRVEAERKLLAETRKAKEDGVITPREAKKLKQMRKNQIRTIQRDMKRLMKAGGSLKTVLDVLDVDEVLDIIKGFLFQLTTVLATGSGKSTLGIFIARYCLFLNLGSLFLDVNRKLDYPLSSTILRARTEDGDIESKKVKLVKNVAKGLVYSTAGYLSFVQPKVARVVNAAMLGAAVIMRGLKAVSNTLWDKKDGQDSMAKYVSILLDGALGGVVMATLAGYGVFFGYINRKGDSSPPTWIQPAIDTVEGGIEKLTDAFGKA